MLTSHSTPIGIRFLFTYIPNYALANSLVTIRLDRVPATFYKLTGRISKKEPYA